MWLRFTTFLLILIFLVSCGSSKAREEAAQFSNDYETIKNKYQEKIAAISSREDYEALVNENKEELTSLLENYKESSDINEILILKARVYIDTLNYVEADRLLRTVIDRDATLVHEAKLERVRIMSLQRNLDEALKLFREIEVDLKKDEDFYATVYFMAMYAPASTDRQEYSDKFLNAIDLPVNLVEYKGNIYQTLASTAEAEGRIAEAKDYINQAINYTKDDSLKQILQSKVEQFQFLGQSAPSISAETWINSTPLKLENMRGKVIIIDFWATWCVPCRSIIPYLIDVYSRYKDRGLEIIGVTKLYGTYHDDVESKNQVTAQEEVSLTEAFIKRYNINYPIAVSNQGEPFESYKITAIPSMIFIDKEGKISHIKIGGGQTHLIQAQIDKLLEG